LQSINPSINPFARETRRKESIVRSIDRSRILPGFRGTSVTQNNHNKNTPQSPNDPCCFVLFWWGPFPSRVKL